MEIAKHSKIMFGIQEAYRCSKYENWMITGGYSEDKKNGTQDQHTYNVVCF